MHFLLGKGAVNANLPTSAETQDTKSYSQKWNLKKLKENIKEKFRSKVRI